MGDVTLQCERIADADANAMPTTAIARSQRLKASSTEGSQSVPLEPAVVGAFKVYASPAEELRAYYRRMLDREYEEHLDHLKAKMRHEYERQVAELDRWRERKVAELCVGLEP